MICAEVERQGAGGGDLFDVDFEHLLLRDEALPDAAVAPVLGRHLVAGAAAAGAGRLHLLHHAWCQGPQLHLRGGRRQLSPRPSCCLHSIHLQRRVRATTSRCDSGMAAKLQRRSNADFMIMSVRESSHKLLLNQPWSWAAGKQGTGEGEGHCSL